MGIGENQNKGKGDGTRGGVTEEPDSKAGSWASLADWPRGWETRRLQDGDSAQWGTGGLRATSVRALLQGQQRHSSAKFRGLAVLYSGRADRWAVCPSIMGSTGLGAQWEETQRPARPETAELEVTPFMKCSSPSK